MAVNLYRGGHHPQHLECLVRYWADRKPRGELHLVVSEEYREHHGELLELVAAAEGVSYHLVPASNLPKNDRRELLASDRRHGRVVSEWARRLRADHVLLMYFDHVQLSLAYDLRFEWPLGISGIYFRPTFYYRDAGLPQTPRERLAALRKRLVLAAALRNPHLRYLFSLDHLAVDRFPGDRSRVHVIALPEPLDLAPEHDARSPIAERAEPGRRLLVLFGSLDERKGLVPVLDALSMLDDREQAQLALFLAGRVSGAERDGLLERIDAFRRSARVQVVLEDRYLAEEEIQPLLRACDLVLLTYVHHVGSSGVVVRAAHAETPVLSTGYGVLGAQVRQHSLGATLDTVSAPAIHATLREWLADETAIALDHSRARAFAAGNTADAFAETILSRVLAQTPDATPD